MHIPSTALLLLSLLAAASPAFAADPDPDPAKPLPIRILILSGQNNHDWKTTTPKLKAILESTGRFTVDVTDRPDQQTAATFAKYDVLLSNWNNWGKPAVKEWPAETRQAFLAFVREGKGLIVVHAGGSSFYDWPEYHELVISWGKTTGHGPVHAFDVKPAGDHPITKGLAPFSIADELWHNPATPTGAKILATAFSSKDKGGSGKEEPVALAHEYGKGRCFNLILGHNVQAMEAPGFQSFLVRGAEWAATGTVTGPMK